MAAGPELAALAAAGGTTLVTAMATDAWAVIRSGFARLLGRGEPDRISALECALEAARTELAGLPETARQQAVADQAAVWRGMLAELLTDRPQATAALAELLAQAGGPAPADGSVTQYAVATGDAQQAVQGHGVQSVTFGVRQR
jgi:hypothetical protein